MLQVATNYVHSPRLNAEKQKKFEDIFDSLSKKGQDSIDLEKYAVYFYGELPIMRG